MIDPFVSRLSDRGLQFKRGGWEWFAGMSSGLVCGRRSVGDAGGGRYGVAEVEAVLNCGRRRIPNRERTKP